MHAPVVMDVLADQIVHVASSCWGSEHIGVERDQKDALQKFMVRLADGDRGAFDPLYEMLWPLVYRFTTRALGGSPDAEDAAQVALMKLFSRAAEFDPERDALSWVLGITAYECKTFRQKHRRNREDPSGDEQRVYTDHGSNPEEAAVVQNLEAAAMEILGTLHPVDVETIRSVIEGRQPEVLGATFRKRLSRALSRWRTAWRSRHEPE